MKKFRPVDSPETVRDTLHRLPREFKTMPFLDGKFLKKPDANNVLVEEFTLASSGAYPFEHHLDREPVGYIVMLSRLSPGASGTLILAELDSTSYFTAPYDRKKIIWLKNYGAASGIFRVWVF